MKEALMKFLKDSGHNTIHLKTLEDDNEMLASMAKAYSWRSQLILISSMYYEKFFPEAEQLDSEVCQNLKKEEERYGITISYNNEALFETVRFAYVAMYHKLENCRNELLTTILPIFKMPRNTFIDAFRDEHNFDFHKPGKGIFYKFSWIANCTKHQNAIASKRGNPPKEFENYEEGRKIAICKKTFKEDSRKLIQEFNLLLMQSIKTCIDHEFS